MASNFLTEYRDRFRAFQTELQRENYLYHSGQKEQQETPFLYSEYSDLFARPALEELPRAEAEIAPYRATERAAIQLLLANATHENLLARVRPLTEEISLHESDRELVWEGETISFQAAAKRLSNEPDARKRHDLYARWADVIKGGHDLRAERWEKLHEAAIELGGENYLALYQKLRGIDYTKLAVQGQQFLAQTESKYITAISPLLVREANVSLDEATQADISYFQRLRRFDDFFPAWQLRHVYRETFSGLGIFTYKQDNLTIAEMTLRKINQARHFPIRVPEEIKVIYTPDNGARQFASVLHEIGHAQHYDWMSRQLQPEFHYCGDYAVNDGFAFLFGFLLQDAHWLGDLLNFYESQELRHILAVQKLLRIRRYAAKLNYEIELHSGQLADTAGARYSELLTDAVRVRYDEAEHLRDLEDGFAVATTLRAWAFEAQLREQLKTKYGSRWWTSRKAGDFLIDLWNTGGRYPADEMATLIDLGELSFDWLAQECLSQL
jgi:hypothetical protein